MQYNKPKDSGSAGRDLDLSFSNILLYRNVILIIYTINIFENTICYQEEQLNDKQYCWF
jgi:hypothetical protein